MELKEGELYTSSRLGLFVITNLYEQPNQLIRNVFGYSQIGTCERLNFGERVYKYLFINDIGNAVSLTKVAALKLKEILNKELI